MNIDRFTGQTQPRREFGMLKLDLLRKASRSSGIAILMLALLPSFATAQDGDAKIVSHIEAFTIAQTEDGAEVRGPADTISPGGIIEYEMTYKNISEDPLELFIIRGEVPRSTFYLSGEEDISVPAVFEVSVADLGWNTPPIVRYVEYEAGILRPVEVSEEEFEALRWRLAEPITPGEEVSATYRIRVED